MKYQILRRVGALVLALALATTLAVPAWAVSDGDLSIESNKSTTLEIGDTATLTAKWKDDEPEDVTYIWSCEDPAVTLDGDKSGKSITVTAKAAGQAKITLTASGGEVEPEITAEYSLTVKAKDTETESPPPETDPPAESSPPVTSIDLYFENSGDYTWTNSERNSWNLQAILSGVESPDKSLVEWSVVPQQGETGTTPPDIAWDGLTATLTNRSAGKFIVTVKYGELTATKNITISGIILSWGDSQTMLEGQTGTITVKAYGLAVGNYNESWLSSDYSVVYVMSDSGDVTARSTGRATVTATKNGYSAKCVITVEEDKSVIAGPYTASTSKPLILSDVEGGYQVYTDLNNISKEKSKPVGGDSSEGSPLRFVNNLKVVDTSQGTLYYNYISEANPGRGVGTTDQFAKNASGTTLSLDMLYFVPKQGFKGTAEITFTGIARDYTTFSGTIKVNVGVSTGTDDEDGGNVVDPISYRTRAGEPVWFQTADFNTYCYSKNGRNLNYITFNLPQASQGTLYYNYVGGSGIQVTTTSQFTRSGRYTINDVCFVPNAAFVGQATISFRGVDSSGTAVQGEVEVEVVPPSNNNDPTIVNISGERGKPVTLQGELFNAACRDTINDTLSFVTFKLPDPKEGALYYNYRSDGSYDSRLTATTRCYYSGVPGLDDITFVPASNDTGRIAISYTGYGTGGTSFAGTLYIGMDEADRTTIRYFAAKNSWLNFRASDFYTAAMYQWGDGVDYVTFTVPALNKDKEGTLYYDYRSSSNYGGVYSGDYYYYSPSYSWQNELNLISFYAGNTTGAVTIPYKAWSAADSSTGVRKSFTGDVVIQIGSVTPPDVTLSCNTSGQARLSSYSLSSACSAAMNKDLSYIEITNVPSLKEGHLYLNYSGFGTGVDVKKGDRFYYFGSPGISQLSFVPRAGFIGEVEITYIGYSNSGDGAQEQVSGRILVNVTQSKTSYFNDMSRHVWAIDSVEYLRRNGTVNGVGGGRYNPTGTITKGDFTLMLVRAYGLTASGSASFSDVPAGSYYADAIRIAALLGIAGGSNGKYNPKVALSRQDAMLMIYNALKASGKTTTNGLAADLSVYHDEGEIDPDAREAMGSLVQMGVVEGVGNGYLQPRRLLNRAEAAKLLHSIMTL